MTEPSADWERHAGWWQELFTDGADPEYEEQILPLAAALLGPPSAHGAPGARSAARRRVLGVGCGEGQVARRLAACDHDPDVVGIDPSAAQTRAAIERGGGPTYARGEAAALPFPDASVDDAIACLVFEHIDDVDGAIAEIARVLVDGGRFVLMLNHPLLQTPGSGWIDDQVLDPPEQYWRVGPYLPEDATLEEVAKDVHIRFVHRPLSRYVNALASAGLGIASMHEPAPPPGFLARAPEYPDAAAIPRLLVLVTERRAR